MAQNNWKPIPGPVPPPPSSSSNNNNKVLGPGWTRRPPNNRPPDWDWINTNWLPPPPTFRTTTSTTPNSATTTEDAEGSEFDQGDITFILISSALVLLMIPGLGFFYSGLTRASGALSLILICFWSLALVSLQWFAIGYSLTFSAGGSAFIGDFAHAFLSGVVEEPAPLAPHLPGLLFVLYQGMFAAITPALIFGSAAERFRFLPATIFIPLWTTFVYDPLAYWTWNPHGWGAVLGGLDFAGGTPVHISSGGAALAYALVLGRRLQKPHPVPHNMSYVLLGTALLWFGWFGFNGGSALAGNSQAVSATLATHLAACAGGITGLVLNYCSSPARTYSALGFCSGAVAGLVCITPAAGFVSPASSLVFGLVGGTVCHIGARVMSAFCCDDALEVFGVHGVGGIVGNIMTGVFAEKRLGAADGGGLDGNWFQVVRQLADTTAGFCWSFVITLFLLLIMNVVPGLKIRLSESAERVGPDLTEHGERCYEWVEEGRVKQSQCPSVTVWHTSTPPPPQPPPQPPLTNHPSTLQCCKCCTTPPCTKEPKIIKIDHANHQGQTQVLKTPPLPPNYHPHPPPPMEETTTYATAAMRYYEPGRQFDYAAAQLQHQTQTQTQTCKCRQSTQTNLDSCKICHM